MTSEEIAALLESLPEEPTQVRTLDDSFVLFLEVFKIQAGEHPVPIKVLYKLYTSWKGDNTNIIAFGKLMAQYFTSVKTKVYINKTVLNINAETYKQVIPKRINKHKLDSYKDKFQEFLNANGITDGKHFTSVTKLYKLYKQWNSTHSVKSAFSNTSFRQMCLFHFKVTKNNQEVAINIKVQLEPKKEQKGKE